MRAWQVVEHGEPEAATRLVDTAEPSAAAGQLVVRVAATALNFPDVLLCRGEYQVRPPLPFTPGVEVCGTVTAAGAGVTRFAVGERVIGTTELPHGGLAESAVLAADRSHAAPEALSDDQAAALLIGHQTAWFALHRRAALRTGETLLVHAAAGGVGSAAVQLGRAAGARVIAVAGGPAKAAVCRRLGADLVIDRTSEDFVAAVKEFTGGRGADVVFDPVGGDAFEGSTKCVAFEGRIVVIGFSGGRIARLATNHVLLKNYTVLGLFWGRYQTVAPGLVAQAHEELTALADQGLVAPLVSEALPLDAAPRALARLAAGETTGRIVVRPAG